MEHRWHCIGGFIMPDWSYHPFFRPLLFQLPPAIARDITFSALGLLASLPFGLGHGVLETLGQMQIPAGIAHSIWGLTFPGPVGLDAGLDVHAVGIAALAHFGFGFLEIGPVTLEPVRVTTPIERRIRQQTISYPDLPINDGLIKLSKRLGSLGPLSIPLGIRLAHRPGASAEEAGIEQSRLIEHLGPLADYFTLDTCNEVLHGWWHLVEWMEHLGVVVEAVQRLPQTPPLLLCLAADIPLNLVEKLLESVMARGVKGVIVGCGVAEKPARRVLGAAIHRQSVDLVRAIHQRWGDQLTIIGTGGIQEPKDALQLLDAGATLVQVHSGLVYAGPGLPKRINEAVKYLSSPPEVSPQSLLTDICDVRLAKQSWPWMALLGVSLLIGSVLAALVALTSVVLPYDEVFVSMTRMQIAEINPYLLPFMMHDRVTLAGTMLSLGILYLQLALYGIHRGEQWAWLTIVISCLVGFSSFFPFLVQLH
jgi:dihydroorotate dehydrogenase